MVTIAQCRAARGLLNWTQQDLADASGMSKTAINNFEKGHSDIKAESLRAIRMAFESADIEFLSEQGLRRRSESAGLLKGPHAMADLGRDIFETMKEYGGEILITDTSAGQDRQKDLQGLLQPLESLRSKNITERILCQGGDAVWSGHGPCRQIAPDNNIPALSSYIYGSKVALELWGQSVIVIIDSHDASKAERARFEYLWEHAQSKDSDRAKEKAGA